MREIKFRAWDKPGELMVYSGLEFSTDVDGDEHSSYVYLVPSKNAGKFYELTVLDNGHVDKMEFEGELMQYTGLKDKNGKEIYEGDICSCVAGPEFEGNDGNREIYWTSGYDNAFVARSPKDPETGTIYEHGLPLGWYKSLEVIGNIYETPELLK